MFVSKMLNISFGHEPTVCFSPWRTFDALSVLCHLLGAQGWKKNKCILTCRCFFLSRKRMNIRKLALGQTSLKFRRCRMRICGMASCQLFFVSYLDLSAGLDMAGGRRSSASEPAERQQTCYWLKWVVRYRWTRVLWFSWRKVNVCV